MKQKIVAMVPARSGSQGLPDKNIQLLNGLPLIAHSILPAIDCPDISATYINSDSQKYLDIGRSYGARPYMRPQELGDHEASMQPVIADFVSALQTMGESVDAVLVLFPTYPFRTAKHLIDLIKLYENSEGCKSVAGFKAPDTHPYLCANLAEDGIVSSYIDFDRNRYYRRQDYPDCVEFTGWAFVLDVRHIDELNAYLLAPESKGFRIPEDATVLDVDTIRDFRYAEFLVEKGYVKAYGGTAFGTHPRVVKTG